jgi:hypothetical protein
VVGVAEYDLALELAVGGELFERVSQRGRSSERDAMTLLQYMRTFFSHIDR